MSKNIHMCVYRHTYIYTDIWTHIYTHTFVYIYVCVCLYMCICICVCACIFFTIIATSVCVFVYVMHLMPLVAAIWQECKGSDAPGGENEITFNRVPLDVVYVVLPSLP